MLKIDEITRTKTNTIFAFKLFEYKLKQLLVVRFMLLNGAAKIRSKYFMGKIKTMTDFFLII